MYKDCNSANQTIKKRLNLPTKTNPMKNLFLFTLTIAMLFSCSNETIPDSAKTTAMVDVPVTIDEIKVGDIDEVKTVAELEIEGMTCAIGCAKMIKKTVSDLDGVEMATVNFDANNPIDFAIVTYDPNKINEYEMAAAVQQLAGGQYKVKGIIVKKYVYSESLQEEEIENNETSMVDVKFSFPNILNIFTLVLR
jgi:copper chaperone CopZ